MDVNEDALLRCKEKTDFEYDSISKLKIVKGDARNLDFLKDESIDFICCSA